MVGWQRQRHVWKAVLGNNIFLLKSLFNQNPEEFASVREVS